MNIQIIELLDFLTKAQKLNIHPTFTKNDNGYYITLYHDWDGDNDYYTKTVFIHKNGESTWDTCGGWEFHTMDNILNDLLEKQEQEKIKEQKRKELIAKLTNEEKELLGVK